MTPGRPWRRRWRDEIVPLACWFAFIVFMFVVVSALSATANAAPVASAGELFAQQHAADVCVALDTRPTIPGVIGVLASLQAMGLSDHESGVAIAESVVYVCPIHADLLRQFVTRYKHTPPPGVIR